MNYFLSLHHTGLLYRFMHSMTILKPNAIKFSNKNSAEVDIAPAFREITTAYNVGQAKKWSWCVLEKSVKENQYARYHTHSYCCCREKCTIFLDISQWSMKGRSRAPGHGVCSKSV